MAATRNAGRIVVSGTLIAQTALRVGGIRAGGDLDLTVLRDGRGRLLMPGDSIAGALRAWADAASTDARPELSQLVASVFGPRPDAGRGGRALEAGLLSIADAVIDGSTEVRSGVGIDRATGAAAPNVYYNFEVVGRGARLPLELELELPHDTARAAEATALLGSLLEALQRGAVGLGGMQTRGLGAVLLDASVSVTRFDYTSKEGTLQALRGGTEIDVSGLGRSPHVVTSAFTEIVVQWSAPGAVLSKDAAEGNAIDSLPLMGAVSDTHVAAVLPGSSIKGVLRSHAEWFCRTLAGLDVQPSTTGTEFLQQVARLRPVDLLFGTIKTPEVLTVETHCAFCTRRDRRGALRVSDCYSSSLVARSTWSSIVSAADEVATARLIDADTSTRNHFDPAMHVAIDRFTGGAAESLLYSILEVRGASWEPLHLVLDTRLLAVDATRHEQQAAIGLFYVLLKMLRHDMVRLGFGSMRGAGRMSVDAIDEPPSIGGVEKQQALDALRAFWKQEVA